MNRGENDPKYLKPAERLLYSGIALMLLTFGCSGLVRGRFQLHSRGGILNFHGSAVYLFFFVLFFISLGMILLVANHYDQRDNAKRYKFSSIASFIIGAFLFVICSINAS